MTPMFRFPMISGLYNQTVSVINEGFDTIFSRCSFRFREACQAHPGYDQLKTFCLKKVVRGNMMVFKIPLQSGEFILKRH